jgi:hypothetical protein
MFSAKPVYGQLQLADNALGVLVWEKNILRTAPGFYWHSRNFCGLAIVALEVLRS